MAVFSRPVCGHLLGPPQDTFTCVCHSATRVTAGQSLYPRGSGEGPRGVRSGLKPARGEGVGKAWGRAGPAAWAVSAGPCPDQERIPHVLEYLGQGETEEGTGWGQVSETAEDLGRWGPMGVFEQSWARFQDLGRPTCRASLPEVSPCLFIYLPFLCNHIFLIVF